MKTIYVSLKMAESIIRNQKGKIFTAKFTGKHDNKPHTVNCRTGVYKFSKGGQNHAHGKNDLVSVFSMNKMAYRNINLTGLTEINAQGVNYRILNHQ